MRLFLFSSLVALYSSAFLNAQDLYFPPTFGTWEQINPAELNWCEENLNDLNIFLEERNTKAFIILKEGRIAVEWYYDQFTQDSVWYWASAGKSLTATMIGIAQEEGLLNIEDATQDYLGQAWTSLSPEQEAAITIRHQMSMTTGLNDTDIDVNCTDPACLTYLQTPGTRWAYHNAPYTLLTDVLAAASGLTATQFFNNRIGLTIGGVGSYIQVENNKVFFSTPRTMARFGHLILARGQWGNTTVLGDMDYFDAMTTPSQNINPSYGYLWWLNGQDNYMTPSLQFLFDGPIIPTAPNDMFAALGKNDQKIYVVPSEGLVVIRMGNDASNEVFALSDFDPLLWEKITNLVCTTSTQELPDQDYQFSISPNPVQDLLNIITNENILKADLLNISGQVLYTSNNKSIYTNSLSPGIYIVRITFSNGKMISRRFVKSL